MPTSAPDCTPRAASLGHPPHRRPSLYTFTHFNVHFVPRSLGATHRHAKSTRARTVPEAPPSPRKLCIPGAPAVRPPFKNPTFMASGERGECWAGTLPRRGLTGALWRG